MTYSKRAQRDWRLRNFLLGVETIFLLALGLIVLMTWHNYETALHVAQATQHTEHPTGVKTHLWGSLKFDAAVIGGSLLTGAAIGGVTRSFARNFDHAGTASFAYGIMQESNAGRRDRQARVKRRITGGGG